MLEVNPVVSKNIYKELDYFLDQMQDPMNPSMLNETEELSAEQVDNITSSALISICLILGKLTEKQFGEVMKTVKAKVMSQAMKQVTLKIISNLGKIVAI
jgi:hypothetical protein